MASGPFRNIVHFLWGLLKRFWPVLLGPVGVAILAFKELYQRFEIHPKRHIRNVQPDY